MAVVLGAALATVPLACSGGSTKGGGAAPAEPVRELLRVGTSGDYPPFSRDGEGFDVQVAEAFAADRGYDIEWVPFRWPELSADVEAGRFDVAMSGVTWRPWRAVAGEMTRAVASSGPCLVYESSVGAAEGSRPALSKVAVNRGGILERWSRRTLVDSEVVTTDDNLSLPRLLESGDVDGFVTDSFEVRHFARAGASTWCAPELDRKVYWITPTAVDLAEAFERWLADNEERIDELRSGHLGGSAPRTDVDHLVDLLARRMAFMPHVARYKEDAGLPVEDLEREARVLEASSTAAVAAGLEEEGIRSLFAAQIRLAKSVQERTLDEATQTEPDLDLQSEIRPVLLRLGERIVEALREVVPLTRDQLEGKLDPLGELLTHEEEALFVDALVNVRRMAD